MAQGWKLGLFEFVAKYLKADKNTPASFESEENNPISY